MSLNILTSFFLFIIVIVQFNTIRAHDDDDEFKEPSVGKVKLTRADGRNFGIGQPIGGDVPIPPLPFPCQCDESLGTCVCYVLINPTEERPVDRYAFGLFKFLPKTGEIHVEVAIGDSYAEINRTVPAYDRGPICAYPTPYSYICLFLAKNLIRKSLFETVPYLVYDASNVKDALLVKSFGRVYIPFPRDQLRGKEDGFVLDEPVDNMGDQSLPNPKEKPQSFPRCGRHRC